MNTTPVYAILGLLAGLCVAVCIILVRLARQQLALTETLNRVRSATYELTSNANDSIRDLRDSLADAGIPLSTRHQMEWMRRRSLTPEESMAEFEATVERFRRAVEDGEYPF